MLGNAVVPSAGETPSSSDEIRGVLGQLGLRGRRVTLSKGSMVSLHEGPHAGLHLLLRGRMKTVRFSEKGRVMILDLLDAGDVFGEMSLVDELGSEPTFAEALQAVEIETIPRFVFERALKGRPALAIAVARLMGARRNRLERRLGTHVFLRVPTRLAFLLLDLAERFGEAVSSPPTALSHGVWTCTRRIRARQVVTRLRAERGKHRIVKNAVAIEIGLDREPEVTRIPERLRRREGDPLVP